jgi:hypothetical protein
MEQSEKAEAFSISVEGDGVAIKKDVDPARARMVIDLLMGGSLPPDPSATPAAQGTTVRPEPGTQSPSARPTGRMSLREFLNDTQASSYPEKIVAIGTFLDVHEGQDSFTREDIKTRLAQAREKAPGNLPRDFGVVLRNGWMDEDPSKPDTFFVTNTGRQAVDQRFSGDVRRAPSARPRRSAKGSGGEVPVEDDE